MADELEQLQAEAEALGVKVDGRWGVERLREEIEKAEAADESEADEAEGTEEAEESEEAEPEESEEAEPEEAKEPVARAGGYVDNDDGRGWVPEKEA